MRLGAAITTSDGQTATVMFDEPNENSNIEDMHYLMVHVEKMKKVMLGKIEGISDPNLEFHGVDVMDTSQYENGTMTNT